MNFLYYSDEWRDDKLMSEMMYNFRPKEVNPDQYNFKMIFWKEMIERYCEYKGSSTFTIQELKEVFKRKGTSPYCLNDIVNQMIAEQNVQNKESFMSSPQSWSQWTFGVITSPVSWSFNKLREKVWGSSSADTVFINKNALKSQAKILQNHVQNAHSYNNIISMDELMKSSEDIDGLSRDGILMTLQYLSTIEKSVYIEETQEGSQHHQKILMKFSQPSQIAKPITQLERSVYNLETTEKYLMSAIDKKENQLNDVLNNVKVCLKDGKKQMAKTHLKKKHMLEADIIKTLNILENIQAMLLRVHNSKSDKEILQTYKLGTEGIKHIFTDSGINIDNVYDVIEDMKDVLGDQDELQNIISTPLRGQEDIDDAELEAELKELLDSEKGEKKSEEPKSDFNLFDLEMRLKRLRGDLPEINIDDSVPSAPKFYKSPMSQ